MIRTDLHTHSTFSADGHSSIEEMCQGALDAGISYLCLTEHYDASVNDPDRLFYNHEACRKAIIQAKARYGDRLTLLHGVEFGEAHRYPDKLAYIHKLELDMIIGSVHSIDDIFVSDPALLSNHSSHELYELYFREVLASVEAGGFDVLGHLDFPVRYYDEYYEKSATLEKLLDLCVSKSIIPEINSSPLRRGYSYTMPDALALSIYSDCGGRYISLGSDGHRAEDIAAGFDYLEALVRRYSFTPVVFIKRELQEMPLP